jgi:hypothetical protein
LGRVRPEWHSEDHPFDQGGKGCRNLKIGLRRLGTILPNGGGAEGTCQTGGNRMGHIDDFGRRDDRGESRRPTTLVSRDLPGRVHLLIGGSEVLRDQDRLRSATTTAVAAEHRRDSARSKSLFSPGGASAPGSGVGMLLIPGGHGPCCSTASTRPPSAAATLRLRRAAGLGARDCVG